MKKSILLLAVILMALPAMSQGRKYKKSMLKTMEMRNDASDRESALDCAATFEEIAEKYPDQWIPHYYVAEILITTSFEDQDMARSDKMLERAIKHLDMAEELVQEESELEVMKAMYYIGMMSADPETRGPMYYQDAAMSIEKAKELNPDNPRAHFLDGMMALNMPDFMGGGPHAAKPIFLKAAEKFKNYENDDPLWPSWGEDLVEAELDKMKGN
ncbi:MAG: hypothetical protein ABFS28_13885 [Bacteroidota bacterium]